MYFEDAVDAIAYFIQLWIIYKKIYVYLWYNLSDGLFEKKFKNMKITYFQLCDSNV